jgi:hypothetical protein
MANTVAPIPELSVRAWAQPDGRYHHDRPHGIGTRGVDWLIESIDKHGGAHVPPGLTVARQRTNIMEAAAWADCVTINAEQDSRTTEKSGQAVLFARALRQFDIRQKTRCGAMAPDDPYFDREPGAEREYARQEWAAANS